MKTALSISVGSTQRDHVPVVSLLGHDVRVERSFGTNATEAALTAASGKGRRLTYDELEDIVDEIKMVPTIEKLND